MRLGQLARKLKIKPEEITSYLEKEHNVSIGEDRNAKVEDEHAELVTNHFAPEPEEDEVEVTKESEVSAETTNEVKEEAKADDTVLKEAKPIEVPEATDELKEAPESITPKDTLAEKTNEPVETIKAPKVELDGPNIIGKIDIPEPQDDQPEMVEVDGVMVEKKAKKAEKKKEDKEEKPKKAKLTEAQLKKKREQEEAEREAKRRNAEERKKQLEREKEEKLKAKKQAEWEKKQEEKEKKKRKEHYKQILKEQQKQQQPKKKKKKSKKGVKEVAAQAQTTPVDNITEEKEQTVSKPKVPDNRGPLTKFWDWLTKG